MTRYEYKAVPAPRRGEKARGVKTAEDRFALALTTALNAMGRDGWEYLRCDTLPAEESSGWSRKVTVAEQSVLVFRRPLGADAPLAPVAAPGPALAAARPDPHLRPDADPQPQDHPRAPQPPEPPPLRREPQLQRPAKPAVPGWLRVGPARDGKGGDKG